MEKFEHSFCVVSNKKRFCKALWFYYLYSFAPRILSGFAAILFLIVLGLKSDDVLYWSGAALMTVITLLEFPFFCKHALDIANPTGVFEKNSEFHFYEDKFSNRCGDSESVSEYRCFTGYFRFNKTIYLLAGKQYFASGFSEFLFADKIDDFIACLEKSGVKPVKFWAIRRWLKTFILIAIFAICFFVINKPAADDFYKLYCSRDPEISLSDTERAEFIKVLQNSETFETFVLLEIIGREDMAMLELLVTHANNAVSAEQCNVMMFLSCNAETMKRILTLKNAESDIRENALFIHAQHTDCTGIDAVLADRKVNVNAKNYADFTPAYYSVFSGSLTTLEKLSGAGADLAVKNYSGQTLLHIASARKDDDIAFAKYLLSAGINVNAQDVWGNTALFYAHSAGNKKITALLLRSGANPAIKNNAGALYDQGKLPEHLVNIAH